jgi:hypothetical protein
LFSGATAAVTTTVAETDLLLSVTDVAVTLTLPPVGTDDGAVNVVGASLAVVAGWNAPQAAAAQVTVQVTCGSDDTSLVTLADSETMPPAWIDAGGFETKETEIGMGAVMAMVAESDRLGVATEVAVSVTVFPVGMAAGAV